MILARRLGVVLARQLKSFAYFFDRAVNSVDHKSAPPTRAIRTLCHNLKHPSRYTPSNLMASPARADDELEYAEGPPPRSPCSFADAPVPTEEERKVMDAFDAYVRKQCTDPTTGEYYSAQPTHLMDFDTFKFLHNTTEHARRKRSRDADVSGDAAVDAGDTAGKITDAAEGIIKASKREATKLETERGKAKRMRDFIHAQVERVIRLASQLADDYSPNVSDTGPVDTTHELAKRLERNVAPPGYGREFEYAMKEADQLGINDPQHFNRYTVDALKAWTRSFCTRMSTELNTSYEPK